MRYVLASGTEVVKYPYTLTDLKADYAGKVSFADIMPDERLAEYNIFPVVATTKPAYDLTKNIIEGTPVYSNNTWQQTWVEVDASPTEIASRQEAVAQALERDSAKADSWVAAFLAMTPAQAEQHVITNGTTVAKLAGLCGKMAYVLRVLTRREFGH